MNSPPPPRLLVIEDEFPMRNILRDCLEGQGYRVLLAPDGESGLNMALKEKPDLILLDLMMPRLDGFALCAELRRLGQDVPILIVTARGRIEDRVSGLDRGADDFLIKPFSREELLARIRALLRRTIRPRRAVQTVRIGEMTIDFARLEAWRREEPVHFTAKEFAMLRLLVERPGEIVSRDHFLDAVWGYTVFPSTRTVDKHIASLRQKLGDDPDNPRWIKTAHGSGYSIVIGDEGMGP